MWYHEAPSQEDIVHPLGRAFPTKFVGSTDPGAHPVASSKSLNAPSSTLHSTNECNECKKYKVHVMRACLQDDPATYERVSDRAEAFYLASPSYTEGTREGRRLQAIEDDLTLARYRDTIRRVRQERNDAVALKSRYKDEVYQLRQQIVEANDRVIAIQMAYDDLQTTQVISSQDDVVGRYPYDESDDSGFESGSSGSDEEVEGMDSRVQETMAEPSSRVDRPNELVDEEGFDFLQQMLMMDQQDERGFLSESDMFERDLSDLSWTLACNSVGSTSHSAAEVYSESDNSSFSSSSFSLQSPASGSHNADDDALPNTVAVYESIVQLKQLMSEAHTPGNVGALTEVRNLITQAERTVRSQRTDVQKYLLTTWRSPGSAMSPPPVILSANVAAQGPHTASYSRVPEIYVDASAFGIGFVHGTYWLAWTFIPSTMIPLGGDGKVVMSWAELVAVELGLRSLIAAGYRSTAITVRSDNQGVVGALEKKTWCNRHGLDVVLQKILDLCNDNSITLKPRWVPTKMNPADGPSRGIYPPGSLMFQYIPEIPIHLEGLVQPARNGQST